MRRERSLLTRLDKQQPQERYTTDIEWDRVISDISLHIQDMLNVRLGCVTALDDYGMPDFNDVVKEFPDAINRIRYAIIDFIQAYEPRLKGVSVTHEHDPFQPLLLKFAISGEVRIQDQRERVNFSTVLTGSGQATVRV